MYICIYVMYNMYTYFYRYQCKIYYDKLLKSAMS